MADQARGTSAKRHRDGLSRNNTNNINEWSKLLSTLTDLKLQVRAIRDGRIEGPVVHGPVEPLVSAEVTPGNVRGFAFPNYLALAILCVTATLMWLFQIVVAEVDGTTRDSEEFTLALDDWTCVIRQVANTPRAIKRYLNRIRYLSMRQHTDSNDRTGWEKFLQKNFGIAETAYSVQPTHDGNGEGRIPDGAIVALGVLELCNPGWLSAPELFDESRGAEESPHNDPRLFCNPKLSEKLPALQEFLPTYRELAGTVTTH